MVSGEEVLRIVQQKGPVIPVKIGRELGSDTITIGALLSELAGTGEIKISNTKLGSSPVYYTQEQSPKLQELKQYLNDKQQKAFELLKQRKVLRESKQEPVIRVSLRDIKDFAKPIEVKTAEGVEIYWKWYLVPNEEAEEIIKKSLNLPTKSAAKEEKRETQERETEHGSKQERTEKKSQIHEPGQQKLDTPKELSQDDFAKRIRSYFSGKQIEVIEESLVRKNSEIDYVIKVPSPVGDQEYYCKAKNKKKSNDGDLSSAYVKAMTKRLPCLYITTGEVTKKATELIETDYKGMIVKQL